jgi:hypothetical protein
MTRLYRPSSGMVSEGVGSLSEASPSALALVASAPPIINVEKVDPLLVSVADARIISGLSRSGLYRRMAAGDIRAVKGGSRTLIVLESLLKHLKSLPAATFRASGWDGARK